MNGCANSRTTLRVSSGVIALEVTRSPAKGYLGTPASLAYAANQVELCADPEKLVVIIVNAIATAVSGDRESEAVAI
jgi:hypothetical protein